MLISNMLLKVSPTTLHHRHRQCNNISFYREKDRSIWNF